MLKEATLYYFSPTGGTKKVGESFCTGLAQEIQTVNLGLRNVETEVDTCDFAVIAAPVFGGRIPAVAIERIKAIKGNGKKAVTLAVYGTRAYEDALLELNHAVMECGFEIVASAALIAQHSIVPVIGSGRPDAKDVEDIQNFAEKVLEKVESGKAGNIEVPGNFPYKEHMKVPATPVSLSTCNKCGACESACPTVAIRMGEEGIVTESEKCILCMACVAHCPKKVRILPPPMQEGMNEKLGVLKEVRRENEYFL